MSAGDTPMNLLRRLAKVPSHLFIGLIWLYRTFISPLKPRCCRFRPTCSEYAMEAFRVHGLFKGCALTVWRLLRCHPFYHGDLYDPVPPPRNGGDDK